MSQCHSKADDHSEQKDQSNPESQAEALESRFLNLSTAVLADGGRVGFLAIYYHLHILTLVLLADLSMASAFLRLILALKVRYILTVLELAG